MAQTTVLRDVSSLMKYLLKSQITELTDDSSITFNSPAEIEETTTPKLSLFLFQVTENTQLRNCEPVYDPNTQQLIAPPVTMDLYYLFTPYANARETELVILENIIGLFQNQLILKNIDQGSEDDQQEIKSLQESLAATGNEDLRIVPMNVPLEELSRLWERFASKPYKLAVTYLVTPVRIPIGTAYSAPQIKEVKVDVGIK
jgi:hypothetical protein